MSIKKSSLVIAILVLLGTFSLTFTIIPENARASTLYVGGIGPGNYTSIQDAIDAANPGDTIYVYNGSYAEHVYVDKTLSLIGEDASTTLIDGAGIGTVVLVSADWVNITGFKVANSGNDLGDAGIRLHFSGNCSVVNNNISSNRDGIVAFYSNDNLIKNNSIHSNTGSGIFVWNSIRSTLSMNTMVRSGVYVWGPLLEYWNTHNIDALNIVNGSPVYYWKDSIGGTVPSNAGQVILANCTDVVVDNQTLSNSTTGIQVGFSSNTQISNNKILLNNLEGIFLSYSLGTMVLRNQISQNGKTGIRLIYSDNGIITRNNVSWNRGYGISLYYSDGNAITYNNASWNTYPGVYLDSSDYNWVHHNNFINNTVQAFDNRDTNHWDNGYPSGGNYWSDYVGIDAMSGPNQDQPGGDGFGDIPYAIDADSEDRYPLMSPSSLPCILPPTALEATLSGAMSENVTLRWHPSLDDGLGLKSVTRYEIYRNSTFNPAGIGYQPVGSVPNGTSEFIDSLAGEGNPENYFYQVCAADAYNNASCSLTQAAKFTRPLSKGPNLISIPLIQSDETIQTVLQTLSYENAWAYDPINQKWRSLSKPKIFAQSLEHLDHTTGIWVNVTQDSNLTVAGVVPVSTTIYLHAGWNIVGFPSFDDNYTVADLKAAVAVERIEGFDEFTPPYFLKVMADSDFLQAGFGYWIKVENPAVWTVENT